MRPNKRRKLTARAASIDTNTIILAGVSLLVLVVVLEAVRLGL